MDINDIPEFDGFKSYVEVKVRWGDMDSFSHVNNIMYFRYFEEARIDYFNRLGIDLGDNLDEGPILADTQCRFRAPVTHPDTLLIASRIVGMEGDRQKHEYVVYSTKLKTVAAKGKGDIVWYDYINLCKIPVGEELIKKIEALEGRKF
jgi:acyl-CoA thioester hydrolase